MYPRYSYNNRNLSHHELLDIIELFLKNYSRPIQTIHNYYYTHPPPMENSQYELNHRPLFALVALRGIQAVLDGAHKD